MAGESISRSSALLSETSARSRVPGRILKEREEEKTSTTNHLAKSLALWDPQGRLEGYAEPRLLEPPGCPLQVLQSAESWIREIGAAPLAPLSLAWTSLCACGHRALRSSKSELYTPSYFPSTLGEASFLALTRGTLSSSVKTPDFRFPTLALHSLSTGRLLQRGRWAKEGTGSWPSPLVSQDVASLPCLSGWQTLAGSLNHSGLQFAHF